MNTTITIITAICFALLTIGVLYVVVACILKKRPERIAFIRSFKKGKCLVIFLVAIPLLFLGYWYKGNTVIDAILAAITHDVELVVLKFKLDNIKGLLDADLFYRITMYYCCVLVIINAILFGLSLAEQKLWQLVCRMRAKYSRKVKLYILGNNKQSVAIYKSADAYYGVIVDDVAADDQATLFGDKIGYVVRHNFDGVPNRLCNRVAKKRTKVVVVINTLDDQKNMRICHEFATWIRQADEATRQLLYDNLAVYVFGDPAYEAVYNDIVAHAFGCIRYKNKYKMIAMDFVDRYPLSRFLDARHVDYTTSLIKKDVGINVCLVGFGKPNQQILLTSIANNQFLTQKERGVGLFAVNYHIFDKVHAEYNKNLNHSYYRYKNECANVNTADYLPLPDYPAAETYYKTDINDPDFYNQIKAVVCACDKDANFVIVSFDNDLQNMDMAQKLVEKRREWGIDDLVIFVRTQDDCSDYAVLSEPNVYAVGNDNECVYNIAQITGDSIFRMAQMRNEIYTLEYKVTTDKNFVLDQNAVLENRKSANKDWFVSKSQLERESSLYSCLSLRCKLNLMGLDYCPKKANDLPALTEKQYMQLYAGDDRPDTTSYGLQVEGKKIVKYTLDFAQSHRKNLAVLEHLRWNSFMITQGMIPSTIKQILEEKVQVKGKTKYSNGKNYRVRRHGNLTTFDGLVTFRRLLAERDHGNEADYDVIKYDYQLMDDAYWLLDQNGYKIIKLATTPNDAE